MRKLALDPMEVPAVQAWLEDWAARGWYLETYGRNLVSFARGERREHIRYRLQPTGARAESRTRTPGRPIGRWAGPTSALPLGAGIWAV